MEDVARLAGISRATLYRFVTGRDELVELALLERAREIGRALEADVDAESDDIPNELVDILIRAIDISRADSEYGYLTEAIPPSRLNQLMTTPRSPVHEAMRYPLLPLLDRGRAQRIIRSDISDAEIIEWIQGVLYMIGPRADLDQAGLARMIKRFALPAIFPTELPT